MVEVIESQNCGNSPKNIFAQNFAIGLSKHDWEFLEERVSSDIHWHIIGEHAVQGKEKLFDLPSKFDSNQLTKITIDKVATHGKAGCVNGTRVFDDGSREEFCDVYEFTNTRGVQVAVIKSYLIRIKG